MIDLGVFKIGTDLFLLLLSVAIFALQLLLCLRVKRRWLRLLPAAFLAVAVAVFLLLLLFTDGWDQIGFLILALWTALLLIPCALGGLVSHLIRRKKTM